MASGPTTAVESAYTYVSVATANLGQPLREQRRGDLTAARYRRRTQSGRCDTPENPAARVLGIL
jgi:hypothetical protein